VRQHLALPALGSFLWSLASTATLNDAELTNYDFLEALRHLAFTRQGTVLRPVDYRNLGAEELGGVYESLLALTPQINADGAHFTFAEFAGNERKTSGSYYTPDSLVQCLLDSALDPVVEERLEEAKRLASREVASRGRDIYASQLISGSQGVAGRDAVGGGLLLLHKGLPQGGNVRNDLSDSTRRSLDPGEYRGGMGPGEYQRIHPVPAGGPGQSQGAGDPSHSLLASRTCAGAERQSAAPTDDRTRQDDSFPDRFFAAQAEVGPTALPPYSLLAEKALLALKVCDPAVGSGHFLVGAAHRLARHLARVRALAQGESEPSPLLYQHALRDVIGRCLYGVDANPMSAELCRVSLWLEALEPGKPLAFLDHHIRVGNSLLGATPALIAAGLPDDAFTTIEGDDAFTTIEGDDKKACAVLKKRNKAERQGLGPLFAERDAEIQTRLQQAAAALEALPDDRPEENPWGIRFSTMFHMSNDSNLFRTREQLETDSWLLEGNIFRKDGAEYLPLYEAKLIQQFNHRHSDFADAESGKRAHILPPASADRLGRADYCPMPFYWVAASDAVAALGTSWTRHWLLGWRRVTDSRASARTLVASLIPRAGAGDNIFLLLPLEPRGVDLSGLLSCLNSFAVDYVTRQKLGGLNLLFYIIRQIPVVSLTSFDLFCQWLDGQGAWRNWLVPRVLELTYTAWDLQPFAQDCGWSGPPFRWDE
jgi:hypothetical protein